MRGEIAKAWLQSMLLFEIRIPVVMVAKADDPVFQSSCGGIEKPRLVE
jgi:hypothetical protein